MSDLYSIKRALADNALNVCKMLYPEGKVEGPEYVVDPGAGKLKVQLRGHKAGVWSHFGGDGCGDLIDLWQRAKSQTLVQALPEIRDYLGIESPQFFKAPSRDWVRPARPKCKTPAERVRDYLVEERNLAPSVLDQYRIGEDGTRIVFPFLRDGELVMAKTREAVDGAKPKPTEAGCEKILFGWQAMDDNARAVVITEGEIDALSFASWRSESPEKIPPALSVPFGGGGGDKQAWIESEFDRLQRFETIYLALDSDTEGQKATEEISRRLGAERCLVVRLPKKDANECLKDGMTAEAAAGCLSAAQPLAPEGLRKPLEFLDEVVALFHPPEGSREGYSLPFGDAWGKIHFRPGEMTIWSGPTGSGKSQLLSHCSVSWIDQGSRLCVASLEMAPARTLRRMVKQSANVDGTPTQQMIAAALTWMNDGLVLFDLVGESKLDRLLEVFDYARARYGCDTFIIDSLMRLGIAFDDWQGQGQASYRLVDWAVRRRVHVHLVVHSRKGSGSSVLGADDVKGAGEITANAPNVITVWRDRDREDAEASGPPAEGKDLAAYEKTMAKPGVVLNVAKQREGDFEGRIPLWFNRGSYQYRGKGDNEHGRSYVTLPQVGAAAE